MDEEAARANPIFDGRVAHGYLILSFAAGLFVDPDPGPVLANYGLENLRFQTPLYPGDSMRVELTVKSKSVRNEEMGEVRWAVYVFNQKDETGRFLRPADDEHAMTEPAALALLLFLRRRSCGASGAGRAAGRRLQDRRANIRTIRPPSPRASSTSTAGSTRAPASTASRPSARSGSRTARCSARFRSRRNISARARSIGAPDILSLTWQDGLGFRWNRADFRKKGQFRYPGEGWGLTQDGKNIIMSDGTSELRFLDPATMEERQAPRRHLQRPAGRAAQRAGMGERRDFRQHLDGPAIARIDPKSGRVKGWIDLAQLAAENSNGDPDAVLNGIAYDAEGDRLFVTGKNWAKLFEIDIVPRP